MQFTKYSNQNRIENIHDIIKKIYTNSNKEVDNVWLGDDW